MKPVGARGHQAKAFEVPAPETGFIRVSKPGEGSPGVGLSGF